MWIADRWEDYEVLDTSSGEKLERWGGYTLIRPDPQVIWNTEKKAPGWRHPNAHYHRSKKGGGEWEFFDLPEQWTIQYRNLKFQLKPFSFKHTGLFPEQAVNWDWFSDLIRRADRPVRVLNLFAYTGGATLAAAEAGAHVTHVDASKGMVHWARENAECSGLSDRPVRWLVDDCTKFVEREIRRNRQYEAVIMDPPSYGRSDLTRGEAALGSAALFPCKFLYDGTCAGGFDLYDPDCPKGARRQSGIFRDRTSRPFYGPRASLRSIRKMVRRACFELTISYGTAAGSGSWAELLRGAPADRSQKRSVGPGFLTDKRIHITMFGQEYIRKYEKKENKKSDSDYCSACHSGRRARCDLFYR